MKVKVYGERERDQINGDDRSHVQSRGDDEAHDDDMREARDDDMRAAQDEDMREARDVERREMRCATREMLRRAVMMRRTMMKGARRMMFGRSLHQAQKDDPDLNAIVDNIGCGPQPDDYVLVRGRLHRSFQSGLVLVVPRSWIQRILFWIEVVAPRLPTKLQNQSQVYVKEHRHKRAESWSMYLQNKISCGMANSSKQELPETAIRGRHARNKLKRKHSTMSAETRW